jgi:hypothetical protein
MFATTTRSPPPFHLLAMNQMYPVTFISERRKYLEWVTKFSIIDDFDAF